MSFFCWKVVCVYLNLRNKYSYYKQRERKPPYDRKTLSMKLIPELQFYLIKGSCGSVLKYTAFSSEDCCDMERKINMFQPD